MPEVYKKFRESQGLASISQALRASQAAKEADPPKKEQTSTAEARKGTKGLKRGLRGVAELGTDVELPNSAAVQKKKGKRRGRGVGQHDGDTEAPGRSGPQARKGSKTESIASAAVGNAESSPSALAHGQEGAGLSGNELHEKHEATGQPPAQTFRDFYVKTFSSAFATELFDLQQAEGEKLSLDLLLRHMESGINIFSTTERELLQQGRPTSEPT